MLVRRNILIFTSLIFLLSMCVSAGAATDWGTKGVSDTTKVTNIVQLTTNQATGGSSYMGGYYTVYSPQAWRKDAKWIAFGSQVDGTGTADWEICKIRPDGSFFTRLTTNSVNDTNASFSTDNRIYYNVNTEGAVVPNWTDQNWRMNQDGSGQTKLSSPPVNTHDESAVVVSPDGSMIAYSYYTSVPPYHYVLMVANADGTSPTQVSGTYAGPTNINVARGHYSWSPDSKWLAYSGNDGTGTWIYKVMATGASHAKLTSTESGTTWSHYAPSWSPDGSTIVYRSQVYNTVWTYQLRTIDTNGNPLKTLDTVVGNADPGWRNVNKGASWSPNSQWVAYTKYYYDSTAPAGLQTSKAIFIVNVKDAVPAPSQLTKEYHDQYPIWSPNGSQILFQSDDYYRSRENDTSPYNDLGDILILNLANNYGSSVPLSWPMFLPAITNKK